MNKLFAFITTLTLMTACMPASKVSITDKANSASRTLASLPATDTAHLMDRRQMTQFIFELVKPTDSAFTSAEVTTFTNSFFTDVTNQTLSRDRDLGRPCIYGELPDATNVTSVKDHNCATTLGAYNPGNVVPTINSGRESSRISFCERVALYKTTQTVAGVSKAVYAVDGFKDKVAKALSVTTASLAFAKVSGAYTVTSAQKANIAAAYQLFYPEDTASDAMINALTNVVTSTSGTSTLTSDVAWSNIFLAVCLSPQWQNL